MQIDKDLLQYCKDKEFPIDEMTIEDFKSVEDTLDFQFYKLGLEFRSLGKEILNALKSKCTKKIEHSKKSCKNFKCK